MDLLDFTMKTQIANSILASLLKCENCPFEKVCIAKKVDENESSLACSSYIEVIAEKSTVALGVMANNNKENVKKIIDEWVKGKIEYDEECRKNEKETKA